LVADALLVGGDGWAAGGRAGGVVDDQEEGQAGLVLGEPGGLQGLEECFGDGEGVGSQRVAEL
jgi:hypothetical protein